MVWVAALCKKKQRQSQPPPHLSVWDLTLSVSNPVVKKKIVLQERWKKVTIKSIIFRWLSTLTATLHWQLCGLYFLEVVGLMYCCIAEVNITQSVTPNWNQDYNPGISVSKACLIKKSVNWLLCLKSVQLNLTQHKLNPKCLIVKLHKQMHYYQISKTTFRTLKKPI